MQKLKTVQKQVKISDTPFDQRSLIHREAWFPGGPRIPQNLIILKKEKIIQNPTTQDPSIHWEAWFPPCFVSKNQQFQTTCNHKSSNLRPLLSITFPQEFRIFINIGHPASESGGKKTFTRYLKSEQTETRTNQLIESIGPEGRCFENIQCTLKWKITVNWVLRLEWVTHMIKHTMEKYWQEVLQGMHSVSLLIQVQNVNVKSEEEEPHKYKQNKT